MKKSQELSLNMIVVGALALLVLLLIGGVLMFSGGDIMGSIEGMGASQEEISVTTFRTTCASKCRILSQLSPSVSGTITADEMNQIKAFCCENFDLNSNGVIEASSTLGPEYCSKAYDDCMLKGRNPSQFCKGTYTKQVVHPVYGLTTAEADFDFTQTYANDGFGTEGCDI